MNQKQESTTSLRIFYKLKQGFVLDRVLFKFLVVGVINTAVGIAIMFSLYNFAGFSYWWSSATCYLVTGVLNFFLNKYFTFNVRRWSTYMVFTFVSVMIFAYLLGYGIAKPLASYLLSEYSEKVRENIAMFVGMCLFTGLNYLGQRFLAFKGEKSPTN